MTTQDNHVAALREALIENKWRTLNRNDDSWQPFPWMLLAKWAYEEGRKASLSQPPAPEQAMPEAGVTLLEEALVYVAHAGHAMPQHMLPTGVCLFDADGVKVTLPSGAVVLAGCVPRYEREKLAATPTAEPGGERAAGIAELVDHYCNLMDNLGDLPIPNFEAWAGEQYKKGCKLLEQNNYFRAAPVADADTLRQCANPDSAAPVAAKPEQQAQKAVK